MEPAAVSRMRAQGYPCPDGKRLFSSRDLAMPDIAGASAKTSVSIEQPRPSTESPREAVDPDLPRLFPVSDAETPDYPEDLRKAERAGRNRWDVGLALSGG